MSTEQKTLVVHGVRQKVVAGKEVTVWINGEQIGTVPHKGDATFPIESDCTIEFRIPDSREGAGVAVAYVKKDNPGIVQLFGFGYDLSAKRFDSEAEVEKAEEEFNRTSSYGAAVKNNMKWLLKVWLATIVVGAIVLIAVLKKDLWSSDSPSYRHHTFEDVVKADSRSAQRMIDQINDDELLFRLATELENDYLRSKAVWQLSDVRLLARLLLESKDDSVAVSASLSLMHTPDDRTRMNLRPLTNPDNWDDILALIFAAEATKRGSNLSPGEIARLVNNHGVSANVLADGAKKMEKARKPNEFQNFVQNLAPEYQAILER